MEKYLVPFLISPVFLHTTYDHFSVTFR